MKELLTSEGGASHFLLGNEAIVRGAVEAGVRCGTAYPGTPSSEIADTFYRISQESDIYFEYSINEKVALEVAMGAALSGMRTVCAMKHVGVNVAADVLMTLAYAGVVGGMVLVSADDPGCHSSQNEQDNRYFALLGNIPMLEPGTPQEAKEMMAQALVLSEQYQLPFLFRTTTRVNHMRGVVSFSPITPVDKSAQYTKQPFRFVCVPGVAKTRHAPLLQQLEALRAVSEDYPFNLIRGQGSLGIITSGVSANYVQDALRELDAESACKVLTLGFTHPLPEKMCTDFMASCEKTVVVEELEPFLEDQMMRLLHQARLQKEVIGKRSGHFSRIGEYRPGQVKSVLAQLLNRSVSVRKPIELPKLPTRPPSLCNGCPHRATFYAVKLITRGEGIYPMDIGCYALGLLPPMNLADFLICMGHSVGGSGGFALNTDKPVVGFIGDSTFFHSGITGLINAVHNRQNFTLIIMDNRTTAMTGHQPHPATVGDVRGQKTASIRIEDVVRAAGVRMVMEVDPRHVKETTKAIKEAIEADEIAVVISRAPCLFVMTPEERAEIGQTVYQVDASRCQVCGSTHQGKGCHAPYDKEIALTRSLQRILNERESTGLQPASPPCSVACPLGTCIPGYISRIHHGKYLEAMNLIREQNPLPSVCGFVCHHPCESACGRQDFGGSVAIKGLKRFLHEHDVPYEENTFFKELHAGIRKAGKSVAVVGSGPSGLGAAYELFNRGYDVTVFEKEPVLGGILAWGIPDFRLPKSILQQDIQFLKDMGIQFKTRCTVGQEISLDDLRGDFDATYLATGLPRGNDLSLATEETVGFYDAMDFLRRGAMGEPLHVGHTAVIIGGGDAAFDSARTAIRRGAKEVVVAYRRTQNELPARPEDVRDALEEGVILKTLISPKTVETENGRVKGIVLQNMRLGEPDDSGRRRPIPIQDRTTVIQADTIIVAIGQIRGEVFDQLEYEGETLVTDTLGKTRLDDVYAGGDAVTGPRTVIEAIGMGRHAAFSIDRQFRGDRAAPLNLVEAQLEPCQVCGDTCVDRVPMQKSDPSARAHDFRLVELGFTETEAREEAARCFTCGTCGLCRNCLDNFGCGAMYMDASGRAAIDEVLCTGCGVCAQICPNMAIVPKEVTS